MRSIWNIVRHKYLSAAATVAMIIMLPVALFISQQPQDSRGLAEDGTMLSFSPLTSPTKPIIIKRDKEFSINLMLEPKNNQISRIKAVVNYDPAFLKPSNTNPVVINNNYFPVLINGPIFRQGEIEISLSNGSDITRSISERTKVLTLNFIALSPTDSSKISFGDNTTVFNITIDNPNGENVLSNAIPAYIKIN